MTNQRSPLDRLNERRERRPLSSLDDLNRTLAALESRLQQNMAQAPVAEPPAPEAPAFAAEQQDDALQFLRRPVDVESQPVSAHAPESSDRSVNNTDNDYDNSEGLAAIAAELQRLHARAQQRERQQKEAQKLEAQKQLELQQATQHLHNSASALASQRGSAREHVINDDMTQLLRRDLDELKRTVETLAREDSLRRMGHRWDIFDERFETFEQQQNIAAANSSKQEQHVLNAIDERFIALNQRLDEQYQASAKHDDRLIHNLEKQLELIAAHLSQPAPVLPELADLSPRLDNIERALVRNQDNVLTSAREAAEHAVRQVIDQGSANETKFAQQMAQDLAALELLTRQSDERNSQTFDTVHKTLKQIANHLAQLERDSNVAKKQPDVSIQNSDGMVAKRVAPESAPLGKIPAAPLRSPATAALEAAMAAVKSDRNPHSQPRSMDDLDDDHSAGGGNITGAGNDGGKKRSLIRGWGRAVRSREELIQADMSAPNTGSASDELIAKPERQPEIKLDADHSPVVERVETTGLPDLNEIIRRVRDELPEKHKRASSDHEATAGSSNADLISAARRTAQAAAQESEQLLSVQDLQQTKEPSAFRALLMRQRKPVLLAIGAIMIAVTGLQLGTVFLSEDKEKSEPVASSQIIDAPASVQQPVQEKVPTPAIVAPASENISTTSTPTAPMTGKSPASVLLADKVIEPTATFVESNPLATQYAIGSPDMITTASISKSQEKPLSVSAEKPGVVEATTEQPSLSPIPEIKAEAGPEALRKAAANGDPLALFEIGNRYMDGRGVTSDFKQAAQWYQLAADRGFAPAQYRLGNFNEKGLGIARDLGTAVEWYAKAAEQGNASAMHNLAVLYSIGVDGKPDNQLAAQWFVKAAEAGVKDSQYNLGILTAKGLGLSQNYEESYKWFALAAEAGDSDAAEKREQVAKSLTPDQLQRAINLAKLWKPKTVSAEANSIAVPAEWSDEQPVATSSVDMKKAVRNIQLILHKNGYDTGEPDGVMGAKTREAIVAFKKDSGLQADGEINQELVAALLARNN